MEKTISWRPIPAIVITPRTIGCLNRICPTYKRCMAAPIMTRANSGKIFI